MADNPSETLNTLRAELAQAEHELAAFARGPVQETATFMEECMKRSGDAIARELARAAASGELSFKRLAKVALEQLATIALNQILSPPKNTGPSGKSGSFVETAASTIMNFNFGPGSDVEGIRRNRGQIASQFAKLVLYGGRNA